MTPPPNQVEADLIAWRETEEARPERRFQIVTNAHAAGYNINQIHTLSGISRSTIYRILDNSDEDD